MCGPPFFYAPAEQKKYATLIIPYFGSFCQVEFF